MEVKSSLGKAECFCVSFRPTRGDCQKKCRSQVPQYIITGTMATPWPIRKERCFRGFASLAKWSVSSLMLLWLPCVLLWLPWLTQAEQLGSGAHSGKTLHGSLSSVASSSSSSSPSSSSAWGFNTRQSGGQLDWLLSEKGPFHRCPEYTEFRERFQQGFSTRYKIYR